MLTRRGFLKVAGTGLAGGALLGVTGCGGSGSGGDAVTVRLAHNLPEATPTGKTMSRFAELVSEKSQGQVTVELFPAGQLYSDTDMIDAIPGGAVDMGMVTLGQWSGLVSSVQIFDYPFLLDTYDKVHQAADGEIGDRLSKELETHGVTPIMWVDYGYVHFVNKERTIKTPEDIKGLRFRAYSELVSEWLRILGAPPTLLGGAEVYTGLERGTIDGAITGVSSMLERAYFEITDYVSIANAAFSMFSVFANLDSWNRLSKEHQEAIMQASNEAREFNRQAVPKGDKQATKELAEKGMEVYTMSESDLAAWREAVEPIREVYLENTGQTGKQLLEIAEGF